MDIFKLDRAYRELESMTQEQRISIRRAFLAWEWSPLLGPAPPDWANLPNYAKPLRRMEQKTKYAFIEPYSMALHLFGVHNSL